MLKLLLAIIALAAAQDEAFRVRLSEDLGTLDWNYGEVNQEIISQIMEGLFTTARDGMPKKALAEDYRWRDSRRLIVKLKKAKWSDGQPLCGSDFVNSWDRLRDPKFASPYAHYASFIESYASASCRELEIRFQRVAPEALAVLSHWVFFPLPAQAIKASPKLFTQGTGLPVVGPYLVKTWERNQRLTIERNPLYYGKRPKVQRGEFLFIPDDHTAKILFDKGEIDWMKDIGPLLRTPELEASPIFHIFPSLIHYYFGLNAQKSELLKDLNLRRALSASLRRDELKRVLGKEARGISSWITKNLYPGLKLYESTPPDMKRAGGLLRDAMKAGKMDLVLRTYNKTNHKLLAEWAQGQWERDFGVRIPIEIHEGKVYWKEISTNPPPIYFSGVTAPFSHPRAFLQEFLSSSTANWTQWQSSEYDAAVNAGDVNGAQKILSSHAFVIPLYSRDTASLVAKKWEGFWINPLGQAFFRDLR